MLISADQPLVISAGSDDPQLPLEADLRLRRALLLAAGDHALPQDQIDAAELALALGLDEAAARLFAVVALQGGFGDPILSVLHQVDHAGQLWPDLRPRDEPASAEFAVDRAIADLRRLMALKPALAPLPED
jgi:hypothetical protein